MASYPELPYNIWGTKILLLFLCPLVKLHPGLRAWAHVLTWLLQENKPVSNNGAAYFSLPHLSLHSESHVGNLFGSCHNQSRLPEVPDGLERWGLTPGDSSCWLSTLQILVGDDQAPGTLPFYTHLHVSQLCWPNHQASWWLLFGCFKKRIYFTETMDFFIHVWIDLWSLFQCWMVCPVNKDPWFSASL